MNEFVAEAWRPILEQSGFADFDALWNVEAGWFEPPNQRRGGWSGVTRLELTRPDGSVCAVFLKRQENHGTFSWRHPFKGIPTFLREFRKIEHYQSCGVPALEPVYFAMRRTPEGHRAILVTAELTGYESMENRVTRWLKNGAPSSAVRREHLQAAADLLRAMHAHGIQHNCFFPKHVFTRRRADGKVEARVIDLEKSRWRPSRTICASRDLYSLIRQSLCWSRTDRLWFFKRYLGIDHLTPYAKWLWRRIAAHAFRKNRIAACPTTLVAREGAAE